jgi:hypothetical protein
VSRGLGGRNYDARNADEPEHDADDVRHDADADDDVDTPINLIAGPGSSD